MEVGSEPWVHTDMNVVLVIDWCISLRLPCIIPLSTVARLPCRSIHMRSALRQGRGRGLVLMMGVDHEAESNHGERHKKCLFAQKAKTLGLESLYFQRKQLRTRRCFVEAEDHSHVIYMRVRSACHLCIKHTLGLQNISYNIY